MVGVPQDGEKTVLQKTQEHNQALYLKQQIEQQNKDVQQQREKAPSALKSDSFQAKQVRTEAAQDEQQAYFGGGFQQKGSSADSFAGQREAALKSGKFDYGAVRSSFYSPPVTFVNPKGERVVRTPSPAPEQAVISFGTAVSGTPAPILKSPILKISQSELQKSNALRASQGLPPLEQVTTVQIVTPTKGPTAQPVTRITTGGKAPIDLRAKLAQAQGTLQPTGGGGEAVSFLRFPFTGNKGPSSGGIQSTTILDPLQFLGIEAGVSLAAKGAKFVGSLIKSEGQTIIKEGAKDIGLNIKPSEAYLKAKSFESQAARLPKPASVKPTVTPKTPTVPTFTSTEVNLGKGLGRTTGKEGGTSATDLFKPSPPTRPSPTPPGKEIPAGKGLVQVLREKPVSKTVQRTKPQFEQRQLQKQDQLLKQQLKPKTTVKTQAQLKTEEYLKSFQKGKTTFKPKQGQAGEFIYVRPQKPKGVLAPPQPKQRQKQGQPLLAPPITKPKPSPTPPTGKTRRLVGLIPVTIAGQKQEGLGMTDILTVNVTRGKTPPPPPPTVPTPPPPKPTPPQTPDTKKRPDMGALLGGARSGALGKVSKSGARKGYIGNVPIESLVGVYKRSEVTYTTKSPSQLNQKQKVSTNRNFKLLGSKSIKL